MPLIDLKELTQNIRKIAAHWGAVNAATPTRPLTIPASSALLGGLTLAELTMLEGAISADFTAVVGADNATQGAQARRNSARTALLVTYKLFRKTTLAYLGESVYATQLPTLPSVGANDKLFEDTGDDLAHIWSAIDADASLSLTRPLTLSEGTDLTEFQSALASVKAANAALPGAKEHARQVRATRDEKVKRAIAALRAYRKLAQVHLPPGHPLLATIPTLD